MGSCVNFAGSGTQNDPFTTGQPLNSCTAYLQMYGSNIARDGFYRVNANGAPTTVYCSQTLNSGGWTRCLDFVNTANVDFSNNNWFDTCVDWSNASWAGAQGFVMVTLRDGSGNLVYQAFGARNYTWSYNFITSTVDVGGQYYSYNHLLSSGNGHIISLSNGDMLMITGRSAASAGCGGSLGNGYGILVYPSSPDYYNNIKMYVLPYNQPNPSWQQPRSTWISGFTPSNELTWNGGGTINTCSGAGNAWLGTFDVFVR